MEDINQIGHVTLWCADLAATRDVFNAVIGLPIALEDADVVVFGVQGTQLILHRAYGENEFRAGTVQIGFFTDTLEELIRKLRGGDHHLIIEQMTLEAEQPLASVRLPGGQYVEFVQRKTEPGENPATS